MDVGIYFFGQKKVAEEGPQHRTSKHHLFIFWGFLIITIATARHRRVGRRSRACRSRSCRRFVYQPLYTLIDVMNLIVLADDRLGDHPPHASSSRALIPWNLDAGLILGGIGSLMITHFLLHGYEIAGELAAGGAAPWCLPISSADRQVRSSPLSPEAAARGHDDRLLAARPDPADVPQLPALLQAHPPARRAAEHLRAQPLRAPDGPAEDRTSRTRSSGASASSSSSRGRACSTPTRAPSARAASNYCPAYNTGKNLSPMQLIHDIRYEMLDRVAAARQDRRARGRASRGLEEFSRTSHGFDDAHPHPDLVFARERARRRQGRARRRCRR